MAINFQNLTQVALVDDETCFNWLQIVGLIPQNPECEVCGKVMRTWVRGAYRAVFECSNTEHVVKNALNETFFDDSNFGFRNILTVMYFFSRNQTNYDFLIAETSNETQTTSAQTICDWLSYCREVCFIFIDNKFNNKELFGGEGTLVEIYECKIGKRKYNQGRLVEGTWIFGLVETIPKEAWRGERYRVEICPDNKRDAKTLIPLILKHIKPKTTILTDMWKSYFNLTGNGYYYFTVNKRKNFIVPTSRTTNESALMALKRSIKREIPSEDLFYHLYEYLYRREVKTSGEDPFWHFLKTVSAVYPGK